MNLAAITSSRSSAAHRTRAASICTTAPPCPVGIVELDSLHEHSEPVRVGGHNARLPRPELQILVTALHDQIHDGAYWTGGLQLRHLIDIAKLTRRPNELDWKFLRSLCSDKFVRLVLEIELFAAVKIAGANVPDWLLNRALIKAEYSRLMVQHNFPAINAPLTWLGRLIKWRDLPSRTHVAGAARL